MHDEVMWERLKDAQREAENRRLVGGASMLGALRLLAGRAWHAVPRPRASMAARGLRPRWWAEDARRSRTA